MKKQDMEELSKSVYERRFLVEGLPESSSPTDSHQQIFDNYIKDTEMRLRKTRKPETDERTFLIEKVGYLADQFDRRLYSGIILTKAEYDSFDHLRGRETRKNRYQVSFGGREIVVDVFLGTLRGLNIAKIRFEDKKASKLFELPEGFLHEITGDPFFFETNFVDLEFSDVQAYVAKKGRRHRHLSD